MHVMMMMSIEDSRVSPSVPIISYCSSCVSIIMQVDTVEYRELVKFAMFVRKIR